MRRTVPDLVERAVLGEAAHEPAGRLVDGPE
eukprot:COSAG03_NODE_21713_length_300_cov_1.258706_2_plen_30_part_01